MAPLFFISFLSFSQRIKWQRLTPTKMLEIGATSNAYNGDLGNAYERWGSGASVSLFFNKKEKLNGGITVAWKSFTGQNLSLEPFPENREDIYPNTFFKSTAITASYNLRYHIIKTEYIHLYIGQGIGLFRFNSRDEEGTLLQDRLLTRNFDESYSNTTFFLPTSLGGIFFLRNGYGIGLQATLHNVLSDYIDNISQLGENKGNDNILSIKASFYVPMSFYTFKKKAR